MIKAIGTKGNDSEYINKSVGNWKQNLGNYQRVEALLLTEAVPLLRWIVAGWHTDT
jgi:hypothetical protein